MECTYDHMSWQFLEQSLESFGFDRGWISWVMACIHGPTFSILVSETPNFFRSSFRLQDYPLYSYLFIIYADALLYILWPAAWGLNLNPYVATLGAHLSLRLLFADDCILVVQAPFQNVMTFFKQILEYNYASG